MKHYELSTATDDTLIFLVTTDEQTDIEQYTHLKNGEWSLIRKIENVGQFIPKKTMTTFPITTCRYCGSADIFEYTSFDGQMIHCETCGKSFDPLTVA